MRSSTGWRLLVGDGFFVGCLLGFADGFASTPGRFLGLPLALSDGFAEGDPEDCADGEPDGRPEAPVARQRRGGGPAGAWGLAAARDGPEPQLWAVRVARSIRLLDVEPGISTR